MSDRKFVRNALRLEARHKGVKESTYVRKSWNELQIEKIGAAAKKHHKVLGTALPPNCPKALMDKWMGYGVNMFSVGQDSFLLSRMLKDNLDACRAMYADCGK